MATWCENCRTHIPELERINSLFEDRVSVFALPIDPNDTAEKLEDYRLQHSPQYKLLNSNAANTSKFVEAVVGEFGYSPTTSSIIFGANKEVLKMTIGFPTISDIKSAMASADTD